MSKVEKWGWYNVWNGEVQSEVFDAPMIAIDAMRKRLGTEDTLEQIYRTGFALALVEVEVRVKMVLSSKLPLEGE